VLVLVASMIVMFSILLYFGGEIYHKASTIPKTVQSEDGSLVYSKVDILQGQKVWPSIGGMQRGSIWGHGSYLAPDTGVITISNERKNAIDTVKEHYASIFQTAKTAEANALKEQYAFAKSLALSDDNLHAFTGFVFWASWSPITLRPQGTVSYTSNFPHDPLVGKTPSASLFVWTIISVM
jgi:nitric oxide reductase subunit B